MLYSLCAKENISAEKSKENEKAWFPGPHGYSWREKSFKKTKTDGQSQVDSLMLSKNKRLNLKKDFKWVASGRKIETKFAKLFIKVGDNTFPRIGIASSSKNFKKATERNRARRLISQALQTIYSQLPTTTNIVALPKVGIIDVKSSEVLADVEEALKNAEIIA